MTADEVQGTRFATLLHVQKTSAAGSPGYQLVFKFLNDPRSPARSVTMKREQVCADPRPGMTVRVRFCLSTVLRIERM